MIKTAPIAFHAAVIAPAVAKYNIQ
jgi:hypothetical protein